MSILRTLLQSKYFPYIHQHYITTFLLLEGQKGTRITRHFERIRYPCGLTTADYENLNKEKVSDYSAQIP